jgi:hypothetical protein
MSTHRSRSWCSALALGALAAFCRPAAALFSTTLSGAPTEAISPGTPGAATLEVCAHAAAALAARFGGPTRRWSSQLVFRSRPLLHALLALTPALHASLQLQPWLTTVDPNVCALSLPPAPHAARRDPECSK